MALETELAYFERHRAQWISDHADDFAVIHDEELLGFYKDANEAYEAGVDAWGVISFLVKEVLDEDRVEHIPALTLGLIYGGLNQAV